MTWDLSDGQNISKKIFKKELSSSVQKCCKMSLIWQSALLLCCYCFGHDLSSVTKKTFVKTDKANHLESLDTEAFYFEPGGQ